MKQIFIFILFIFTSYISSIEDIHGQIEKRDIKNAIYLGYGGAGIFYSINYERNIFSRENYQAGVKAGIGTSLSPVLFPSEFNFPLGIFFQYGKNQHHLDLSIHATSYLLQQYDHPDSNSYKELKVLLIPSFAYRYEKPEGGILARIGISPLIHWNNVSHSYSPWIDAGVGWGW